ncbi:MAG: right-handed parallel beta-helix repeat-containing protein [Planctomycetota bacterium]|jgi:parallel beta-helix repeat protein/predicted outer membrane repeat protein
MSKKTNLKMCLIPVFLLGMLSTVPVQAIVYVDDNAPAPGNGLTWSTAYPALQDALYDPVLGPNDQIRVAQGTYKPDQASLWYSPMSGDRAESFQLVNGVSLKGGYNGAYSGPGDPDARNIYTYQTILSGDINTPSNTDNSYHVVTGSWTDQSAIIDGFTITAGYANGPPMDNWGGGMYNFSGSPTVSNCTFSSNTAEGDGGGMANDTSSDPTVTNCTFTGNSATGLEGNGGGMYNNDSDPILVNCAFVSNSASYSGGGMGNGLSSPTLTGCIFTDNSATVYGGGMSNVYNCYPKLTDCNVSGNEAQYGGGMHNYQDCRPTLVNCTFNGNSATGPGGGGGAISATSPGGDGGAINNWLGSSPTLINCTFTGNEATSDGGAINIEDPNAMLTGCTFSQNNAGGNGGGINSIATLPVPLPRLALTGCTFSQNSADGNGGGISNIAALPEPLPYPTLTGCSFSGNQAGDSGGGMYNQDTSPVLNNCTFSANNAVGNGGGMNNVAMLPTPIPRPELTNCTFSANTASGNGGGMCNVAALPVPTPNPTLTSSIFWGNRHLDPGGGGETAQIFDGTEVSYCCIEGLNIYAGNGNIGDDPCFVDPNGPDGIAGTEDDDLHLLEDSPCIDAGAPGPENQDDDGTRNDMGVYGGPMAAVGGVGSRAEAGFIFTTIGNIPTSEIIRTDACEARIGLVDVNATEAAEFGIPIYEDCACGGTLWLHGLFGANDDVNYYQILVGKWNNDSEPSDQDYVALSESLTKVRWFIDPCGIWAYEYVTLGPKTIPGADGNDIEKLYELTDQGYWSHIDLRAKWNTSPYENGKYTMTYKAYRWDDPCDPCELVEAPLPATDGWDEPNLIIDNNPPTATIHNVKHDSGQVVPECAIIALSDPCENLRFDITASHPTGYLRGYTLRAYYGKNQYGGTIDSNSYDPATGPYWGGVTQQEIESGGLIEWQQCAYQFHLGASSRITNGYYYIYSAAFSDHYYLDQGTAYCGGADIDRSGRVDFRDLARLASRWLEEPCGP